jgi:plastocyanin
VRGRSWGRALVAGAALAALAAAGYALAAGVTVTLGAAGPQPGTVTADWGDTLAFVNGDSVTHGITSPRTDLQVTAIPPAGTYTSVVTAHAGSYKYRQTGAKDYPATVVVLATGTVKLKAAAKAIAYGRPLKLTGTATKPGTPVLVEERLTGDTTWHPAATLTSGDDGSFAAAVELKRSAKLRASIDGGQVSSTVLAVSVKPVLAIVTVARKTTAGRMVPVVARLTPPHSATRVTLSQCNADTVGWRSVSTQRPAASGRISFRWKAGYGRTLLRVAIKRADAATGFSAVTSRTVAVNGAGVNPSRKHRTPRCS